MAVSVLAKSHLPAVPEHERKEAGRIRLNVQLINTRTDTHVWAQEYDRDLSDVFALQSEIAQKVAECVAAKA